MVSIVVFVSVAQVACCSEKIRFKKAIAGPDFLSPFLGLRFEVKALLLPPKTQFLFFHAIASVIT